MKTYLIVPRAAGGRIADPVMPGVTRPSRNPTASDAMDRCAVLPDPPDPQPLSHGIGDGLVTQAWLAVIVPVALMAGALAMQRFEHHLLGPAPRQDDESLRAGAGRVTKKPVSATTAPHAGAPLP